MNNPVVRELAGLPLALAAGAGLGLIDLYLVTGDNDVWLFVGGSFAGWLTARLQFYRERRSTRSSSTLEMGPK